MTVSAEEFEQIKSQLPGSNIHESSFLATDYLNHLNEAVMMLEMVPDMPDLFDEVVAWQPKPYVQHFLDSNFAAKELAVQAYEAAPSEYREPFDQTVAMANQCLEESKQAIEPALSAGDMTAIAAFVNSASTHVRHLIDIASAIIHGNRDVLTVDKVMELQADWDAARQGAIAEHEEEPKIDAEGMAQDDIDALFD